jgi:uncharacterized protein (TIGR00369 family)
VSASRDLEARVRRGFEKQGFMKTLGAELVEVSPGECRIAVPYSSELTQQHGLFHGGVTATLADNTAGFAGYTLMADDEQPLGVEFKISFVAPAEGERLEARAKVVNNGRRLKHARVEIFSLDGNEERLVAIALATIAATRSVAETD